MQATCSAGVVRATTFCIMLLVGCQYCVQAQYYPPPDLTPRGAPLEPQTVTPGPPVSTPDPAPTPPPAVYDVPAAGQPKAFRLNPVKPEEVFTLKPYPRPATTTPPNTASPRFQQPAITGFVAPRPGGILLSKAAAERMAIDIDIQAFQFEDGHIVFSGPHNRKTRLDAALFVTTLRMACERGYNGYFSLDPDRPSAWLEQGQKAMKAVADKVGENVNWKSRPNIRDGLTVETYSLKRDFPKLWAELAPYSEAMRSKLVFGPAWLSSTRVGEILYKADVLLKDLTSGVSLTRPGQPSRTALIKGYASALDRRAVLGLIGESGWANSGDDKFGHRMWFSLMPSEGGQAGIRETFNNPLKQLTTGDARLRSAVLNERYTGQSSYRPILKPAFYVSDSITDLSQIYPKMFMRVHDIARGKDVEGSDPHHDLTLWEVNQDPERYVSVFDEMRDLSDVFRAYVASVKIVQKDRAVCGILARMPLLGSEKVRSALPAFHPSEVLVTVAIWVENNGRRRNMRIRYAMSHDGGISMHGAQFVAQAELRQETTIIRETKSGMDGGIKGATWRADSGRHFIALRLGRGEDATAASRADPPPNEVRPEPIGLLGRFEFFEEARISGTKLKAIQMRSDYGKSPAASRAECAQLCSADDNCIAFEIQQATNTCHTYSTVAKTHREPKWAHGIWK